MQNSTRITMHAHPKYIHFYDTTAFICFSIQFDRVRRQIQQAYFIQRQYVIAKGALEKHSGWPPHPKKKKNQTDYKPNQAEVTTLDALLLSLHAPVSVSASRCRRVSVWVRVCQLGAYPRDTSSAVQPRITKLGLELQSNFLKIPFVMPVCIWYLRPCINHLLPACWSGLGKSILISW